MGTLVKDIAGSIVAFATQVNADGAVDAAWYSIDLGTNTDPPHRPTPECHGEDAEWPLDPCDDVTGLATISFVPGDTELSYDVLWHIATGDFIRWRENTVRYIFFFGDERAQGRESRTQQQVADALAAEGIIFVGWVGWQVDYDTIADVTDGQIFDLRHTDIAATITPTLRPVCE
jgi:hypothetical protein